jgi:hypothetical protein
VFFHTQDPVSLGDSFLLITFEIDIVTSLGLETIWKANSELCFATFAHPEFVILKAIAMIFPALSSKFLFHFHRGE